MSDWRRHPETRRLLRDSIWVGVLLALLWSPLPELVLGRWLLIGNATRPETGRAHDRLDLLQESDSQAVVRSTVITNERQASAAVATLSQMRDYLMSAPDLVMSMEQFRVFYSSLSTWQQDQFISADDLSQLVQRGLAGVTVKRHGSAARFIFQDAANNRLAGTETDLLRLQLLPLGLTPVGPQDAEQVLKDPALVEIGQVDEAGLFAAHRDLLKRLRLLPGIIIEHVWQVDGNVQLLEIRAEGDRQYLRPSSTDISLLDSPRLSAEALPPGGQV